MLELLSLLFSLFFLEFGWIYRKERFAPFLLSLGFFFFGLYWPSLIGGYLEINDVVNAALCALAFPFFLVLSLKSITLYNRGSGENGFFVIAQGIFIAAFTYFLIDNLQPLAELLKRSSALEANAFAGFLGVETHLSGNVIYGNTITFEIILACTALQSIMIFLGFILPAHASSRKKIIAAASITLTIYLLNIVRNGGIIFLAESGVMSFETAHNILGKAGSLAVLFALAVSLFYYLPELLDDLIDVFKTILSRDLRLTARGGELILILIPVVGVLVYTHIDVAFLVSLPLFFLLFFFRDPERGIGKGIISPADGRVIDVEEGKNFRKISIFMSLLDVHVNRVPCDGEVIRIERGRGKHVPAFTKRADENFYILTEMDRIKIKQIAGIFARRIVNYLGEGQKVKRGDRLGLIRFGSRVDVIVFSEGKISVKKGDRVLAGESTLIEQNI